MLYSVRMRSAKGGAHEAGGRHISGAERLVEKEKIQRIAGEMVARALGHSRGCADFITVTIDAVNPEQVRHVQLLPVTTVDVPDVEAGRKAAMTVLLQSGVSERAVSSAMAALLSLPDSMRGAMLFCKDTGKRLDETGQAGIRVSRMDIADDRNYHQRLSGLGLTNIHVREALVLASKVAAAPQVAAELCWSDDPEYTVGYVASPAGYCRFTQLKEYGSPIGGRIFFLRPGTDLAALIDYLGRQPVLVTI